MSSLFPPPKRWRPFFSKRVIALVCLFCGPATTVSGFPIPNLEFAPRRYVCPRADGPVTIDGRLDEKAWESAPWTEDFVDIEGPGMPAPFHRTAVRMLWDENYFYVAARLDEPHVWGTLTDRDAVIYHDNDFEVFIDPDGDNHLYYELEINALGTEWDLMLIRPYRDGGPAINAWDIQGLRTAVHVEGTLNDPSDEDEAWSVEIAFPWAVLAQAAGRPSPPAFGDIWRVNFSRVHWRTRVVDGRYEKLTDPDTGKSLPEFNWVWSPQGLIAMHYPEMWGEVLFVPEATTDFDAATEHAAITAAASLMPIYYRQKQWFEDHGRFAATLAELGIPDHAIPLPSTGTLSLEACGDGFTARLETPYGTATVDQFGRLERTP